MDVSRCYNTPLVLLKMGTLPCIEHVTAFLNLREIFSITFVLKRLYEKHNVPVPPLLVNITEVVSALNRYINSKRVVTIKHLLSKLVQQVEEINGPFQLGRHPRYRYMYGGYGYYKDVDDEIVAQYRDIGHRTFVIRDFDIPPSECPVWANYTNYDEKFDIEWCKFLAKKLDWRVMGRPDSHFEIPPWNRWVKRELARWRTQIQEYIAHRHRAPLPDLDWNNDVVLDWFATKAGWHPFNTSSLSMAEVELHRRWRRTSLWRERQSMPLVQIDFE